MNSASDSLGPFSLPPQSEQFQQRELVPLVEQSEPTTVPKTADESSIVPSVRLLSGPPLPEFISSDKSSAPLSLPPPTEAVRRPRSTENSKALILNANNIQKHISSNSQSKSEMLEGKEKGPFASEPTTSAASCTENES